MSKYSKDTIHIKCIYFSPSGKYKYDGSGYFDKSLFHGCIYPNEFGKRLRELHSLPGLQSGKWKSAFTVETDYTELVLGEDE